MNPVGPKQNNDPKPQPKPEQRFVESYEDLDKKKEVAPHEARYWFEEDVQKEDDVPAGLYDPIINAPRGAHDTIKAQVGQLKVQQSQPLTNNRNKEYKEIELDKFLDNRDSKDLLNFTKLAIGEDLSGADLSDMNISNFDFSGASLAKAEIIDSTFKNVNFSLCDLSKAHLENVTFINCKIDGLDLTEANLENVTLDGMSIKSINLSGTKVISLSIKDSQIHDNFKIDKGKPMLKAKDAFKVFGDSKLVSSTNNKVLAQGAALKGALEKAFAAA